MSSQNVSWADRLLRRRPSPLGGHPSATALRVRDRESGWVRRNFPRYPYWSVAGVPDRWVNSPRLSKSAPNHESHRRRPRACGSGAPGKTEDGRRVRLEATAKGTKILQEGRRRRVESLAKAVSSFSEKEQQQLGELTDLLQQVIRNL